MEKHMAKTGNDRIVNVLVLCVDKYQSSWLPNPPIVSLRRIKETNPPTPHNLQPVTLDLNVSTEGLTVSMHTLTIL